MQVERGPAFLALPSDQWPVLTPHTHDPVPDLRRTMFCGLTQINKHSDLPDPSQFNTWQELVEATYQSLHDTAKQTPSGSSSFTQAEVEIFLLSQAQSESFPEDFQALKFGKDLPSHSSLSSLSPQFDHKLNLIIVGGRLCLAEELEAGVIHPIVLHPKHRRDASLPQVMYGNSELIGRKSKGNCTSDLLQDWYPSLQWLIQSPLSQRC